MSRLKLEWFPFAEQYDIYRSDTLGEEYNKITTVSSNPENGKETYLFDKIVPITGLKALGLSTSASLSWDEPCSGSPELYKIVASGDQAPSKDTIWLNNWLPYGSTWVDVSGASWSPRRLTGDVSLKIETPPDEYRYPQLAGSNYPMQDRYIVLWIYIDPENIPDEIMISFYDGSWEHRVYWGDDLLPFGKEGTHSKLHMGSIFAAGCWVPVVVDKYVLNCQQVSGIGFAIFKKKSVQMPSQRGIVYIDGIINTDESPYIAGPHIPVEFYKIYRRRLDENSFTYIDASKTNSFIDDTVVDIYGYNSSNYSPAYQFVPSLTGESIDISWTIPQEHGTKYFYRVAARDGAEEYPYSETSALVSTDHSKVVIYAGASNNPLEKIAEEPGSSFTHANLLPDTVYNYKLESYNHEGNCTSVTYKSVKTRPGSMFDSFILDLSTLA